MALKQGAGTATVLWEWVLWARRSRIPAFVELQRSIVRHWQAITAAADHGLSNGLIESTNTKIRLITRIAFGFKSPDALIALAMLHLGGNTVPAYQAVNSRQPDPRNRQESPFSHGPQPERRMRLSPHVALQ